MQLMLVAHVQRRNLLFERMRFDYLRRNLPPVETVIVHGIDGVLMRLAGGVQVIRALFDMKYGYPLIWYGSILWTKVK